jgi:hypothetical protein
MPFVREIVDYINTTLSDNNLSDSRFSGKQIHGISTLLPRNLSQQATDVVPGFVNEKGDATYVGVDDSYPLVIYHRSLSKQYEPIEGGGYGDRNSDGMETTNMLMTVFARRDQLRLTAEDLLDIIAMGMPDTLPRSFILQYNSLGLYFAEVATTGASLDREQAFGDEYKGLAEFPLKPEHIFFTVNYTITTKFKKGCYVPCVDC